MVKFNIERCHSSCHKCGTRKRKFISPRGNIPQNLEWCVPMLYHWATENSWGVRSSPSLNVIFFLYNVRISNLWTSTGIVNQENLKQPGVEVLVMTRALCTSTTVSCTDTEVIESFNCQYYVSHLVQEHAMGIFKKKPDKKSSASTRFVSNL